MQLTMTSLSGHYTLLLSSRQRCCCQVVPFHGTFEDYKKRLRAMARH
jgi:hypothetical protein